MRTQLNPKTSRRKSARNRLPIQLDNPITFKLTCRCSYFSKELTEREGRLSFATGALWLICYRLTLYFFRDPQIPFHYLYVLSVLAYRPSRFETIFAGYIFGAERVPPCLGCFAFISIAPSLTAAPVRALARERRHGGGGFWLRPCASNFRGAQSSLLPLRHDRGCFVRAEV